MPTPLSALTMFAAGKAMDNIATAKQQENFEKNLENQQRFTRSMARDSTILARQGMKMAGLNPASMTSPMSPVGVSAPSHGAAIPTDVSGLASLASVEIQGKLAQAEINKMNAETNYQEIINSREVRSDEDFNVNLKEQLQINLDILKSKGLPVDQIERSLELLEENPANLGTFIGAMKAMEVSTNSLQTFTDKIASILEMIVKNRQINDKKILDDLTFKDPRASRLMYQQIATQMAQEYYLTQSKENLEESFKNIKKEGDKLDAEVSLMAKQGNLSEAEANKIKNADVNTLLENGEVLKALRAESVSGVEQFSKGLGQGLGLAAGYKVTGMLPNTKLGGLSSVPSVGKTTLAKKSSVVKNKLENVDKRTYNNLKRFYGEKNANKMLNEYMRSNSKNFNSFLDNRRKMKKK